MDLKQRNEEMKNQLHKKVQEVQKLSHWLEEIAIDTETVYESLEFQDSLKIKIKAQISAIMMQYI